MKIAVQLADLPAMHPRLLWHEIIAAAAIVLGEAGTAAPYSFDLTTQNVPAFEQNNLILSIAPPDFPNTYLERLKRTYEPSRLVELAAIAVAGLGLYHGGGHEILDIALRGSSADYLVDEAGHLLEIAGRSRRSDFRVAWDQRQQRLRERHSDGYYLCVVEFETPAGRLSFFH
jgi:hypothetical protein